MSLGVYNKAVGALVVAVLGWAAAVIASAPKAITASEWLELATAAAVALGVRQLQNDAPRPAPPAPPAEGIGP